MNLASIFAILKPDQGMDTLPVAEGFYDALDRDYNGFKGHVLVSVPQTARMLFVTPGEGTQHRNGGC